jgi:hypothetical protein
MTACESVLNDLPAKETGCPGDSNMHRFSNTATKGGPQYSSLAGASASVSVSVSVSGGGLELGVSELSSSRIFYRRPRLTLLNPLTPDT